MGRKNEEVESWRGSEAKKEGVGGVFPPGARAPHSGDRQLERGLGFRLRRRCFWVSVPLHPHRVCLGSPSLLDPCFFFSILGGGGKLNSVLSAFPKRTSSQSGCPEPLAPQGCTPSPRRCRPDSRPPLPFQSCPSWARLLSCLSSLEILACPLGGA